MYNAGLPYTVCGITIIEKQKGQIYFKLLTQANVLGQEGLTTRMSYERGSGYGNGRGRSYGGGGNRGFTEVLLLQNQLR